MKSQKRHNPLPPPTFLRPDSIQVAQDMYSKFKIQNSKFTLGNTGFTLIEIAVVLVILGVVFMSVLKIESIVKNAKIRQVISQYRELRTAILIYKDKYGYLPGDDPYAVAHVGSTHQNVPDNGAVIGNQKINPYPSQEYVWIYEDLNRAGLIKGNFLSINWDPAIGHLLKPPLLHAFGNQAIVSSDAKGNHIRFYDLPADVAQAIDTMLDDGKSTTGTIGIALPPNPPYLYIYIQ